MVDHEGVALDKQSLTWPEVQSIRGPRGPRFLRIRSVTVVPLDDPQARSIAVQTTHVRDLDTFTHWLRTVHERQRAQDPSASGN